MNHSTDATNKADGKVGEKVQAGQACMGAYFQNSNAADSDTYVAVREVTGGRASFVYHTCVDFWQGQSKIIWDELNCYFALSGKLLNPCRTR